jgi:hypothetical protein
MYANFLSSSNRGAQALALLTTFRASQLGLEPMEDFRLLSAMANAARGLGDNEQAAKYDAELQAKQREEMPDLLVVPVMDDLFGKAEAAASEGRIAEALGLAMQGLTAAGSAENREPVGWQIPAITSAMTAKGGNAAVEQLYAQALLAAESWVDDSLVPLLNLEQSRAGGLIQDPLRRGEARLWIDRYRELLVAARGSDSGTLAEPMRMSLQLEQARPAPVSAVPALDLVAFEEGVNGGTSEPFLEALGALAETYQMNQEWDRVAGVRRRMVQIGDLAYEDGDVRRGQTRAELAMALAQMGRFVVAEQMALEAIAAGRGVRRTPGASFEGMLQQIRQMRAAGRRK